MESTAAVQVSEEERGEFTRNGVVKIAKAVDDSWIDRLLAVADRELATPGPWVTDSNPAATTDRLFTTRYLWEHDDAINDFVFQSGVAALVGQLLDTDTLRFYFDHLLVKEPHTVQPTPWHQDIPYWPFLGSKIASAWVALTPATVEESSLEFVKGSHLDDAYYAPASFGGKAGWTADFVGEPVPDIEGNRSDYDIEGFDVEPGDALVFSAWSLHGAPGNSGDGRRVAFSTRWLGDDASWAPHPGTDPTVAEHNVSVQPGEYPADDVRFPVVWRRP
jgi:ectoine hydroxylase-related dioxygenase (phytanoyl-CoA dioxygenase family)